MRKLILALLIAVAAGLSSGCSVMPKVKKVWGSPFNFAGVIERHPASDHPWRPIETFNPVPAGTLRTGTDEIWYRRNFSGSETKVLWGLFTVTDY